MVWLIETRQSPVTGNNTAGVILTLDPRLDLDPGDLFVGRFKLGAQPSSHIRRKMCRRLISPLWVSHILPNVLRCFV